MYDSHTLYFPHLSYYHHHCLHHLMPCLMHIQITSPRLTHHLHHLNCYLMKMSDIQIPCHLVCCNFCSSHLNFAISWCRLCSKSHLLLTFIQTQCIQYISQCWSYLKSYIHYKLNSGQTGRLCNLDLIFFKIH